VKQETFETTADSLQEARKQAVARIPQGFYLQSERVLSSGEPVKLKEAADESETALATLKAKVPKDARILEEKELQAPETTTVRVSAEDEKAARAQVEKTLDKGSVVKSVSMAIAGKSGFLGIGRTIDQYDVQVCKKAVVELTYKSDAKIAVTISDEIASWLALLSALGQTKDPLAQGELLSRFPYHILFDGLRAEGKDASYFDEIPFIAVTKELVDKARRYVDQPPVPPILALGISGGTLPPDRYTVVSGENVKRSSSMVIDSAIVSVAGCLRGRGMVSVNDPKGANAFAWEAVRYYTDIPLVYFFFVLPYLESVVESKLVSRIEALITVYKGVEGLLLQIWDELAEGQIITDDRVKNKVSQMLLSG
jgi:hypothetical protein